MFIDSVSTTVEKHSFVACDVTHEEHLNLLLKLCSYFYLSFKMSPNVTTDCTCYYRLALICERKSCPNIEVHSLIRAFDATLQSMTVILFPTVMDNQTRVEVFVCGFYVD